MFRIAAQLHLHYCVNAQAIAATVRCAASLSSASGTDMHASRIGCQEGFLGRMSYFRLPSAKYMTRKQWSTERFPVHVNLHDSVFNAPSEQLAFVSIRFMFLPWYS